MKGKEKAITAKVPVVLIIKICSEDKSDTPQMQFARGFPLHAPKPPDSDTDGTGTEHPLTQPTNTKDPLDKPEEEQPPLHKSEHAYVNTSLTCNTKVAQKVYEQILETGITLLQQELLLLAPELCTKIVEATVKRCLTRTNVQTVSEGIPEPKLAW
jgi:hypothetical protein